MLRRAILQFGGAAAGAAVLSRSATAQAAPAAAHDHPPKHSHAPARGPAASTGAAAIAPDTPAARAPIVAPGGQVAVVTPNGSTLQWRNIGGVKVGHLIAGAFDHEFAAGLRAEVWGYNGGTPGPTIEAISEARA